MKGTIRNLWCLLAAVLLCLCVSPAALAAEESLDLSGLKHTGVQAAVEQLKALPGLKTADLGEERENGPTWADIRALEEAAPQAAFSYRFTLYGKSFTLQDEEMDLNHIPVNDRGELVRQVIACMPRLRWLCMDSCGVSNEDMASIREDFPEIEVVWRIWFGTAYSVRTDVEKILASQPYIGGNLMSEELNRTIVYCSKLKYLDLGHNHEIRDISFVRGMPDLEVLILALNHLGDLSPLEDCPKLEYLEIFMSDVSDLTPLKDLKELRHLNMCDCFEIVDITPLYGLDLERLSFGNYSNIPKDQIEEFKRLHPDCWVDDFSSNPSQTGWRWNIDYDDDPEYMAKDYYQAGIHPRYALLIEQFGYHGENSDYSYSWLDPNY